MREHVIGIIGGMGPHAGVFLAQKLIEESAAPRDAEHVPFLLASLPGRIADRSNFLERTDAGSPPVTGTPDHPATGILAAARTLIQGGATVLAMPCNTAHAAPILEPVRAELASQYPEVPFLHLIQETVRFVPECAPGARRIGVLATLGTYRQRLYANELNRMGLEGVLPDTALQQSLVHRSIYDPDFGIKSQSNPVREEAVELLALAVEYLRQAGAEAVILGCTELPLALPGRTFEGLPVVDSTTALARALIRYCDTERLRTLR